MISGKIVFNNFVKKNYLKKNINLDVVFKFNFILYLVYILNFYIKSCNNS